MKNASATIASCLRVWWEGFSRFSFAKKGDRKGLTSWGVENYPKLCG